VSVITDVRPTRGGQREFAVFVDGVHAFDVDEETLLSLGIRPGCTVDSGTIEAASRRAELSRAKGRALRLIGVRDRSEQEMRERLGQANFSGDIIEEVLSWLTSMGYLDDRRFAERWVDARVRHNPLGRRMLQYELQQKGVARSVVESVLERVDGELETRLAREAAVRRDRRLGELPLDVRRRRIYSHLVRRGFRSDAIRKALDHVLSDVR